MSRTSVWSALLLASALYTACGDSKASTHQKAPPPPAMPVPQPLTAVDAAQPAEPAALPASEPSRATQQGATRKRRSDDQRGAANASKPPVAEKPQAAAVRPAAPMPPVLPSPAPKAANDPEKPKSKVRIPETPHLRIQVPPGLQEDLDKDPRMQPWANQVVSVIDGCHGKSGGGPGTIEVRITMHENARPDAELGSVPNALAPIVACATGGLLRTKMPLFTGREGQRYTVRVQFN